LYFNISGLLNFTRTSNKTKIDITKIEKNIFSNRKLIYVLFLLYINHIYRIKLV